MEYSENVRNLKDLRSIAIQGHKIKYIRCTNETWIADFKQDLMKLMDPVIARSNQLRLELNCQRIKNYGDIHKEINPTSKK